MRERISKENYQEQIKSYQPKPTFFTNCLKAYIVGGLICVVGQVLQNFYTTFFDFSVKTAASPTMATMIALTALLTGMGIFDKLGQFAGAGTLVPITGFANAMVSAALEHRSEGYVIGIGNNMFKLAGSVIVYGVVATVIIGLIRISIKILLA